MRFEHVFNLKTVKNQPSVGIPLAARVILSFYCVRQKFIMFSLNVVLSRVDVNLTPIRFVLRPMTRFYNVYWFHNSNYSGAYDHMNVILLRLFEIISCCIGHMKIAAKIFDCVY